MMMFNVVVQELARLDAREAGQWYNLQKPGLSKKYTNDMVKTLRQIARNPSAFAIRYKNIRLANFETFPYAVHFYILENDALIVVIAILHTSRNPNFSKTRK